VFAFLEAERTKAAASINAIVSQGDYEQLSDISTVPDAINSLERSLTSPTWAAAFHRFPPKSNVTGTVANVKDFGVFVELEPGISGLIPAQRLPLGFKRLEPFSLGERIVVEIQSVNAIRKRIDMSYVGPAPEEDLTEIQQMTLDMTLPTDAEPAT
jgi:small subunit ribosomal protein S1